MSVRVAIVGGGPKALHALERLVAHLPRHANAQVDVFEPSTPGAGPAYAPDVHPALLMNLRSELVDAWPRSGPQSVPTGPSHPTFAAWSTTQGANVEPQDAAPAEYASRATVGAYLSDALQRVVRDAA
ncbi:MAG: FAD/NAD(P)-binding protein, partial [Solirubrobacteraceae bacterium]|nr:FAD/NAD(P)-binding protein [Solirubrobacteraceae bacterium]